MPTVVLDTKFYAFSQNNSGGSFDPNYGYYEVIEALSADDANRRAEDIGIYFDGCDTGRDCSCCGDRWSRVWRDEKGTDTPQIYDTPVKDYWKQNKFSAAWGLPVVVRYMDGRIEKFAPPAEMQTKKRLGRS